MGKKKRWKKKARLKKKKREYVGARTIERVRCKPVRTLTPERAAALQKMLPIIEKQAKPRLIRVNGKVVNFDDYDEGQS